MAGYLCLSKVLLLTLSSWRGVRYWDLINVVISASAFPQVMCRNDSILVCVSHPLLRLLEKWRENSSSGFLSSDLLQTMPLQLSYLLLPWNFSKDLLDLRRYLPGTHPFHPMALSSGTRTLKSAWYRPAKVDLCWKLSASHHVPSSQEQEGSYKAW